MPFRCFSLLLAVMFSAIAAAVAKPTLYIIGDSTVRNGTEGQMGWGDPLVDEFDPAKISVVNRAIGGRSSRTFLTQGRWDAVMAHLKPGDFLLMQFGHNDGGKTNDERCRATLRGIGEETEDIVRVTDKQPETVRTYGWYMRKFVSEAKAKGVTPIVVSLIPRNIWKDGKIGRSDKDYALWAEQVAQQEKALFINFNSILADRYEAMGPEKTAALFAGTDHTHTGPAGAVFNAVTLASVIRSLPDCELGKFLLPSDLWLPSVFSDHMVLQRDMAVPVWGTTTAGTSVTVKLAGKSVSTTAAADGKWRVDLPAQAAGGPFKLEISAGATKEFNDVMVGEVWLCSGQSNMDFTLAKTQKRSFSGVTGWEQEVAAANHPKIRMFTAEWAMSEFPRRDVPGQWAVCSPETAGDFSAAAYYFGRDLQEKLDVPIGLITCAYGASTIESWISEPGLTAHPQFKGLLDAFAAKRLAFRDDPKPFQQYGEALAKVSATAKQPKNPDPLQDQHNPFVLHNGMIAPVAPYAIRGAIWYQGESNMGSRSIYPELQQTLISEWREIWRNPELPFYFVQLAPHKAVSLEPSGGQLPEMREAQSRSLSIPHTGMVVTLDIGDEKDVHPRNKLDVGRRLALLALSGTYGKPGVSSGPTLHEAEVQEGRIRLHFDNVGGGLVAKDGPLKQCAIAGADRKFFWAEAVIEGDGVIVCNPAVLQPLYVRYAWAGNPAGANLFNVEGLPAAPFRTDP